MIPCYHGTVCAVLLGYHGFMAPRHRGAIAPWFIGPWCHGIVVPRYHPAMLSAAPRSAWLSCFQRLAWLSTMAFLRSCSPPKKAPSRNADSRRIAFFMSATRPAGDMVAERNCSHTGGHAATNASKNIEKPNLAPKSRFRASVGAISMVFRDLSVPTSTSGPIGREFLVPPSR